MPDLTSLDIVMPVWNEKDNVRAALESIEESAAHAGVSTRLIVIDDGSAFEHAVFLDELAREGRIHLFRQENSGRFLARQRGMEEVTSDYVLLMDARVRLYPDTLTTLRAMVQEGSHPVWSAHVDLLNAESPWTSFWFGITCVWWREYFKNPRRSVLTEENFDDYPKGTGAFFARSDLMRAAMEAFTTRFEGHSFSSDDTGLLRYFARNGGINLTPQIRCGYYGKDSLKGWARQSFYRGTTFIDGYLPQDTNPAYYLAAACGVVAVGVAGVLAAPRTMAAGAAGAAISAGVGARWCGATLHQSASVTALCLPFGFVFGAGLMRGLVMATKQFTR